MDSESKNLPPLEVAEPRHLHNLRTRANNEETQQDGANKSPSAGSSESCSDFAEGELMRKSKWWCNFRTQPLLHAPRYFVDPSHAHFDYERYAPMVTPVTQVFSFADLDIIPTYCAFESTSKVGNSNAERVYHEMPLAEDSPFSSDNDVVMSMEGNAGTTEAHMLNECSQQTKHEVFVDEQSDATTFSSEGHSDLEDEMSEEVCDVQAKFEGSMSAVQKTQVANDQEFVPEDFSPILGNIQLNIHVSTSVSISKCASISISHRPCLFTNFNSSSPSRVTGQHNKFELSGEKLPLGQVLDTCCCHKKTCSYLHFELEPILDILPFGSVEDAWVDTGQL
ncbi:hypothetical protein H5410_044332 [Solanum commersonii]|uniref:Uncharacterized protein n=1 Tax=Solanum commersonii TaxID=4109 RepID=A0A9J5X7R4_SOLCO|nr:hypothetical protein H5410_044332 [Solanum commersonii]